MLRNTGGAPVHNLHSVARADDVFLTPPRRLRFVEALQNAAYNAPPFPAGRRFSAGILEVSLNATRCRTRGPRGGIFVVRRSNQREVRYSVTTLTVQRCGLVEGRDSERL